MTSLISDISGGTCSGNGSGNSGGVSGGNSGGVSGGGGGGGGGPAVAAPQAPDKKPDPKPGTKPDTKPTQEPVRQEPVRRNDEPQAENANYYTQGSQGGLNALSQPEQRQGQTTQQDDTQQDGMSSGGIPTHHIYEHHPLDKPILQYSTYQFRDWQLSDNYGDNALFRLHDGKLIFAGSPTDNNFRHFDFEAPSDRDRNNIYELEFVTTDTNGARITNRLNIKVNDLVNETTNPGQGRLL